MTLMDMTESGLVRDGTAIYIKKIKWEMIKIYDNDLNRIVG